ncbi:hypothetical protein EXIGLDRAFT_772653 [Exidia glandulosa HHB12029]|uniref:Uncharacterized protein n=1 Tax=Exidia glandulosa HHB12029 TaxID=1314781 RepID=A0A166A554_EXIGL|nr:hypothetical protein EXIGLDRAFT_772653 [Exidia glandulosa HHB12029]
MTAWLLAIAIEIYCHFPGALRTDIFNPLRYRRIPSRLLTLTAVVIGEGLNGFVGPIVNIARSGVGFNVGISIQLILTGVTIFLAFCIYVRSFRLAVPENMHGVLRVILAHFPVHLALILFLEGLKSLLNLTTLDNSLHYWLGRYHRSTSAVFAFQDELDSFTQLGLDLLSLNSTLTPISYQSVANHWDKLQPLALHWDKLQPLPLHYDPNDTYHDVVLVQLEQRLLTSAIQAIYNVYGVLDSKKASDFRAYIYDVEGGSVDDLFNLYTNSSRWKIDDLMDEAENDIFAPATWVTGVAAAVFLALGLLMVFEGIPRHKYAWWSAVLRFVGFGALMLLSLLNLNSDVLSNWLWKRWTLPTISISYIIVLTVDYLIGWIAVCEMDGLSWWRVPLQPVHALLTRVDATTRLWINRLRRAMTLDVQTVA